MGIWEKLTFIGLMALSASTNALEFVPKDQAKELVGRFSEARPLTEEEVQKFADRDWRCDMYGMRTRLQVEREVRLYRFSRHGKQWKNIGAQMIQDYKVESSGFVGRKGKLNDRLRIVGGDTLVAQLSMDSTVLAVSVCRIGAVM